MASLDSTAIGGLSEQEYKRRIGTYARLIPESICINKVVNCAPFSASLGTSIADVLAAPGKRQ